MVFYHSRFADEPTDMIVSLLLLWFLSNVVNNVEKIYNNIIDYTKQRKSMGLNDH